MKLAIWIQCGDLKSNTDKTGVCVTFQIAVLYGFYWIFFRLQHNDILIYFTMTGDEVRPVWVCAGRDVEADCLQLHTWPRPQPAPSPHHPDAAPLLLLNTPAFAEPWPPGSQCSGVLILSILPTNISITIPQLTHHYQLSLLSNEPMYREGCRA